MTRTVVAALVALVVLACAPQPSPQPDGNGRGSEPLPQSDELAGRKIEVATDGPWTVRRTVRAAPSGGRGGVMAKAELEDAVREEARTFDAGDEPTSGAPAEGGEFFEGDEEAEPAAAEPPPAGTPAPDPSADLGFAAGGGGGSAPGGRPATAAPVQRLRAGSTDDNEEYAAFLEFLAKWSDKPHLAGRFQMLDVRDRRYVRVVNSEGKPIPAAEVRVVSEAADRILLSGTTYGDGRVPFYPHVAADEAAKGPAAMVVSEGAAGLLVEARFGDARKRARWDGEGEEFVVELPVARPVEDPVRLDVCILLDTTGSMSDEIERIKATLLRVTERLRSLEREFDLRYGAVLYRDIGDEYVTKAHPFTSDIRAFDAALQAVRAAGGGDGPESLNQGLAEAVGRLDWRAGAAKVAFLIADAPPHMDYEGDVPYGESTKAAVARGIRVHSVAASGIDEMGSLVFRQVAQFTRGKFIFIEYGTVEASAAAHGVKGKVEANNLDDILFEQIREEVARWGRGS